MSRTIKAKQPMSTLGGLLFPDFSKEEDLGDALRTHVMNTATIFRAARAYAEHGRDIHGTEDLIELGIEILDALTEAYEVEEMERQQPKKTQQPAA